MYMSLTKRWRSGKPLAERWRKIIPRSRDVMGTTFKIRVSWAVVYRAKALGIRSECWHIPYDGRSNKEWFSLQEVSNHHRNAMTMPMWPGRMSSYSLSPVPVSKKEPKPFSAPSSTASACVSAPIGTPGNEMRETYDVSRCRKTYMRFNKGTPTGEGNWVPATTETTTLGPNLQTTSSNAKVYLQKRSTKCIRKRTWVYPQTLAKCFQKTKAWHPMPSWLQLGQVPPKLGRGTALLPVNLDKGISWKELRLGAVSCVNLDIWKRRGTGNRELNGPKIDIYDRLKVFKNYNNCHISGDKHPWTQAILKLTGIDQRCWLPITTGVLTHLQDLPSMNSKSSKMSRIAVNTEYRQKKTEWHYLNYSKITQF